MSASMCFACCVRIQNILRFQTLVKSKLHSKTKLCHKIGLHTFSNVRCFTTAQHHLQKFDSETKESAIENEENDFFGINILEKCTKHENIPLQNDEIYQKHEFCNDRSSDFFEELHQPGRKASRHQESNDNAKFISVPFGQVRLDRPRTKVEKKKGKAFNLADNEKSEHADHANEAAEKSIQNKNFTLDGGKERMSSEKDNLDFKKQQFSETSNFIDSRYFGDYVNEKLTENVEEFNDSLTFIDNSKFASDVVIHAETFKAENKILPNIESSHFIDQQYFQDLKLDKTTSDQLDVKNEKILTSHQQSPWLHESDKIHQDDVMIENDDMNFIDEQYFQESRILSSVKNKNDTKSKISVDEADNDSADQIEVSKAVSGLTDQTGMSDRFHDINTHMSSVDIKFNQIANNFPDIEFSPHEHDERNLKTKNPRAVKKTKRDHIKSTDGTRLTLQVKANDELDKKGHTLEDQHDVIPGNIAIQKTGENIRKKKANENLKTIDAKADTENPRTAYDVAMKIRKEKSVDDGKLQTPRRVDGKLVDSMGYRILKDQVPDLTNLTMAEVTDILYENIIYNRNDIVAINKPYGLASQGGEGIHLSVAQLLEPLAKKIDHRLEMLHIVHRLDQGTTGVMLLAKTPEVAALLKSAFKNREVEKCYWVITKCIPSPLEGRIVIPMAEGSVDGKKRMVLKPHYDEDVKLVMKKSSVKTYEAITNYKVLTSKNNASLIECRPETGVKHQIRVHLAWGLNTPILGDHKYAHLTKMAPQKLPGEMLHKLNIRQSKVRHVPMHLHAKSIIIPEFLDGQNIFISCKLPPHFVENMKKLKLKP